MTGISRFDLADFASPERIVDGIIQKIPDLPIPVPVVELALMLDIISIEELESDGYEGGLLTDAEKSEGFILLIRGAPCNDVASRSVMNWGISCVLPTCH